MWSEYLTLLASPVQATSEKKKHSWYVIGVRRYQIGYGYLIDRKLGPSIDVVIDSTEASSYQEKTHAPDPVFKSF